MRYEVKCGILKSNGLRFYTQYDGTSTKEFAVICINAGSFNDPPHCRGLAHLVEHVICAESEKYDRNEVDLLLTRATGGPDDNIYITTNRTVTTYGASTSLRKQHNRKLFRMFASMVKNPVITDDTLRIERAAVHQEHYFTGEDVVGERIYEMMRNIIFPEAFLARIPIDGRMADVRRVSVYDIKRHVHRYYVPANTFVVYFGPKHEEAKRIIEEKFSEWGRGWKKGRNKKVCILPNGRKGGFVPLQESCARNVVLPGIHQYHAAVGFPTETYNSDDAEALDVLARILSSRMYSELRTGNQEWNKGTYRTTVLPERTFAHGMVTFYFVTLDKEFAHYGLQAFKRQCDDLCANLARRDELEAWVGYLYDYEFIDCFQMTPDSLMEMVVEAVSNGDESLVRLHSRGERLNKLLRRGGRQKLRAVAQKYFSWHNATVMIQPQ